MKATASVQDQGRTGCFVEHFTVELKDSTGISVLAVILLHGPLFSYLVRFWKYFGGIQTLLSKLSACFLI